MSDMEDEPHTTLGEAQFKDVADKARSQLRESTDLDDLHLVELSMTFQTPEGEAREWSTDLSKYIGSGDGDE